MRAVSVALLFSLGLLGLFACDQLNRPMPVTTGGTSASSGDPRVAPSSADAGGDGALPALPPGDQPRVTPQPGDVQL